MINVDIMAFQNICKISCDIVFYHYIDFSVFEKSKMLCIKGIYPGNVYMKKPGII